jgi:hypothetical protein
MPGHDDQAHDKNLLSTLNAQQPSPDATVTSVLILNPAGMNEARDWIEKVTGDPL